PCDRICDQQANGEKSRKIIPGQPRFLLTEMAMMMLLMIKRAMSVPSPQPSPACGRGCKRIAVRVIR
ncbi:MAG: hypothetical protein Q8K54_01155, partial [Gallionella sp.]|nr:hypothetical protein [Gallionella sp.]